MKRLILFLVIFGLLGTGCSKSTPYAAKVNGEIIEDSVIENEIRAVLSSPQYTAVVDQQLQQSGGLQPADDDAVSTQYAAQILFDRVRGVLMKQELQRLGVTVSDAARAEAEAAIQGGEGKELYNSLPADYRAHVLAVQAEVAALVNARTTPENLRKYYDEHQADFSQVCFLQIPAENEAQAQAYKARIEGGEPAATVANEAAAAFAQPGSPAPTIEELSSCSSAPSILQTLEPVAVNGVSEPIDVQGAYLLAQVTSRKQLSFEEAQQTIQQTLGDTQSFFSEALKSADIDVNPRYGTLVLPDPASGSPGEIKPPEAVKLSDGSKPPAQAPFDIGQLMEQQQQAPQ